MWCNNIAEKFNPVSTCTNVTDDRQTTDGIAITIAERNVGISAK